MNAALFHSSQDNLFFQNRGQILHLVEGGFSATFCVYFFILVQYLVIKWGWTEKFPIITHFCFYLRPMPKTYDFSKANYFESILWNQRLWWKSSWTLKKDYLKARHMRKTSEKKFFFNLEKIPSPTGRTNSMQIRSPRKFPPKITIKLVYTEKIHENL